MFGGWFSFQPPKLHLDLGCFIVFSIVLVLDDDVSVNDTDALFESLLIVFVLKQNITTDWTCELELNPLLKALGVKDVRLVAAQTNHRVSNDAFIFLSFLEVNETD